MKEKDDLQKVSLSTVKELVNAALELDCWTEVFYLERNNTILKVYRKILVELRHRQCPDGLTVTLSTASLNSVPPAGTVGRVAIPGSGEG